VASFIFDGACLALEGITILIIGQLIIMQFRQFFQTFFNSNRFKLIAAAFMLSVPITITGIFVFSVSFTKFFTKLFNSDKSDMKPTKLYIDIALYMFGILIPLCAQLASLVFGLIRNSSVKVLKQKDSYRSRIP
jgi:hypothetical protein